MVPLPFFSLAFVSPSLLHASSMPHTRAQIRGSSLAPLWHSPRLDTQTRATLRGVTKDIRDRVSTLARHPSSHTAGAVSVSGHGRGRPRGLQVLIQWHLRRRPRNSGTCACRRHVRHSVSRRKPDLGCCEADCKLGVTANRVFRASNLRSFNPSRSGGGGRGWVHARSCPWHSGGPGRP